jgi:serine/threonine protein kinase
MEQIRLAEEQLMQQQMQMQMQQANLVRKAQELEARTRLEEMKKETPNWQINYEELEFEHKIGEGGFGEVFRAKWRGTTVAVKTLKGTGDALNPKEVEKFSKEVTILRALHHPNLVLFLGACLSPRLCMISEFMFGGSLYELLYKKKKLPDPAKRQALTLDIARAMAYLHNSKPAVIHRDLKSLNILLDEKGEHAKVCDVGLARFKSEQHALTGAVGTFSWMPPEMMKGLPYTEKADVYSFALVMYEMISGKLPFAGLPPQQISLRVAVYDERPQLPASCPTRWKELIQACWAAEDTSRPSFIDIIEIVGAIEGKK